MTVANHIELRARDLIAITERVGDGYDFVCCDSKLNHLGNSSMWKASLKGEMEGYTFYVHVYDGVVKSSSIL